MAEQMGESELRERLSALADGELDAAQTAEVLRQIAGRGDLAAELEQHLRLNEASRRVIQAQTPPASAALRAKILALPVDSDRAESRRMIGWPMVWSAAAAALIFGLLIGYFASAHHGEGPAIVASAPQPVPATLVEGLTRTHVDCSRFAAALHSAPFPAALGDLAADLRADLSSDKPYPDLTKMGYKFVGAGPCGSSMPGTVHLLYHSMAKTLNDSVSIFVQANTGQYTWQRMWLTRSAMPNRRIR